MQAIFYRVETNDFIQPANQMKCQTSLCRMQNGLHNFYSPCSLLRPILEKLPPLLPELPYAAPSRLAHEQTQFKGLSDDGIDCSISSPEFGRGSESHRSPDDRMFQSGGVGGFPYSLDSNCGSERNGRDSEVLLAQGHTGSYRDPVVNRQSDYQLHYIVSSPDLMFFEQVRDRASTMLAEEYINHNNQYNDDILFWTSQDYDKNYVNQFIRSLIKPSIFPLVVSGKLSRFDSGDEVKGNHIIISHQPRDRLLVDFIRLRLSFNFQFEESIPSYLSLDSVTMALHHKEEHRLSVVGNHNVSIDLKVF